MNRVRPQKIAARHLKKITLSYDIYEFEWHTIEDIDYESVQDVISEISFEPGTSLGSSI